MTKWYGLPEEIFLEDLGGLLSNLVGWSLLRIQDIHVRLLLFSLFFFVLLYQEYLVLVEMPEYIIIIQQVFAIELIIICFDHFFGVIGTLFANCFFHSINFIVESLGSFLDVIESVECIHEVDHAFGELLRF